MKVFGGLMMGCGILIALISGLCTAIFLSEMLRSPDGFAFAMMWGGIPFLVGVVLVIAGRQIVRSEDRPKPPGDDVFR